MILRIFLGLLSLIALFLLVVAMRSSDFRVTRSLDIPVTADVVFAQVNDLRRWETWSPWAKLDPSSKATFTGPEAGVGASMSWAGNDQVGEGTMTILESRPNEYLRIRLEFRKPFVATNQAEFTFTQNGGETDVAWSMFGRNSFLMKMAGLFMDCDKMLGDQFEQGLKNLSAASQAAAK